MAKKPKTIVTFNGKSVSGPPTRPLEGSVAPTSNSLVLNKDEFPLITLNKAAAVVNQKVTTQRAAGQVANVLNTVATSSLTTNFGMGDFFRTDFLRFLLDGPRNIDAECGYPAWLTPDHYRAMYDREGISARVVNCEPEESWIEDPDIYEDEDEDVKTAFEQGWEDLDKQFKGRLTSWLQQIDVLSGIGQYGILLLGIDDGMSLADPVKGFNDDGTVDPGNEFKLMYIRAFSEEVLWVKARETDTNNPRYGLPIRYTIQFRDFPNWGVQAGEIIARDIHWSRVIHVADNKKQSEVYGIPRMQQVYNRLYDLRKIYSSSGEAFWKGAFPGIAFTVDPDVANQGVPLDKSTLRDEFERYQSGLQRYLALTGVTAKSLEPNITDPTATAECHLKAIAIAKGIPYRVLFGSEEAKLAADQDSRSWLRRVSRRQETYVTPGIIRPFVDRMIDFGVIPPPQDDYTVEWSDLYTPTDTDKATVALTRTQAMQAYIQGGVSQLIGPIQYLTLIMSMTKEEAMEALQEAAELSGTGGQQQDDEDDSEEFAPTQPGQDSEGNTGEGSEASDEQNPDGNALMQTDLSGSSTVPKNKKPVSAQLVQQPALNQRRRRRATPDIGGRPISNIGGVNG